jgi:hypothetical protein
MSSNITRVVLVSVLTLIIGRSALAATPQQKCSAAKLKAAGKDLGGQMRCYAIAKIAGVAVDPGCLSQVQGKADTAITKAGAACLGTAADIDAAVSMCIGTFLSDDPGNGACPAGSAKVIGKGAQAELRCEATEVRTPGRLAACERKEDGRTTDGLMRSGACVDPAVVATDIDACDTILTASSVVCGDLSAPTCGGTCLRGVCLSSGSGGCFCFVF